MARWQCRALPVLCLAGSILSCQTTSSGPGNAVDLAKSVVRSHEQFARSGDLDGILSNVAEDVVVLSANAPLVKGKAAFREMYAGLLKAGTFDFGHDYEGSEVVGDTVILHGVARGTFTPVGAAPSRFANNFMLALKRQPGGKFQFWRIAFAPSEPQ